MMRMSTYCVAAAVLTAWASSAPSATAQCMTCPAPTVTFAPVVAAPVTVVAQPRLGLFDRWRLRRWSRRAPVATVATPSPVYTAAFAPTASASFSPAFVTSFAPLQRQVVTASFAPLQQQVVTASFAPAADSCACSQTAFFAPAALTPVAPACTTCSFRSQTSCSTCDTGASFAVSAGFSAPSSDCASCATGSGVPYYPSTNGSGTSSEPAVPQPEIPDSPAPTTAGYPLYPYPEAEPTSGSSAPPLLEPPATDRTANRPTVGVHAAVYRTAGTTATDVKTTAVSGNRRAVVSTAWESVD